MSVAWLWLSWLQSESFCSLTDAPWAAIQVRSCGRLWPEGQLAVTFGKSGQTHATHRSRPYCFRKQCRLVRQKVAAGRFPPDIGTSCASCPLPCLGRWSNFRRFCQKETNSRSVRLISRTQATYSHSLPRLNSHLFPSRACMCWWMLLRVRMKPYLRDTAGNSGHPLFTGQLEIKIGNVQSGSGDDGLGRPVVEEEALYARQTPHVCIQCRQGRSWGASLLCAYEMGVHRQHCVWLWVWRAQILVAIVPIVFVAYTVLYWREL